MNEMRLPPTMDEWSALEAKLDEARKIAEPLGYAVVKTEDLKVIWHLYEAIRLLGNVSCETLDPVMGK